MLNIQKQPRMYYGDKISAKASDPGGGVVNVTFTTDGSTRQTTATYADVVVGDYLIAPVTLLGVSTRTPVWEHVTAANFTKYYIVN